MKNIKLLLGLILIGMIILTGCGDKTTEEGETEEAVTEEAVAEEAATEEAVTEEAATEEAVAEETATEEVATEEMTKEETTAEEGANNDAEFLGSIVEGKYVNNYFGISFDLPERWDQTTAEEIAEWNGINTSDTISEDIKAKNIGTLFITYSESQVANIDIGFEKVGLYADDLEEFAQSEYDIEKELSDEAGDEYMLDDLESNEEYDKANLSYDKIISYEGFNDVKTKLMFETNGYFISLSIEANDDEVNDLYDIYQMVNSLKF